MRRGELINLKWNDVDFENRAIVVRKSKAGKQRVMLISDRLTSVIRNLKCMKSGGFVFLNRDGILTGISEAHTGTR